MKIFTRTLAQIIIFLAGIYFGFSALSTFSAAIAVFDGASSDTDYWLLALLGIPSLVLCLACFFAVNIIHKNLKFGRTKVEWELERANIAVKWKNRPTEDITNQIKNILSDINGVEKTVVTEDLNFFRDLKDSFVLLELLINCEETFGVQMPEEETAISQITTVGELTDYIVRKLNNQ